MSISREAVEVAALAVAGVWTSEDKKADMSQATVLFEPSAEAALTAALPHLLAAKDAEIAALTQERDMWKGSSCAMEGYVRDNDDKIAALREALDLIEPYQDVGGHWCVRCGDSFWTMPAQDEAERIAIVRRAALEMSGGVTPKRDEGGAK